MSSHGSRVVILALLMHIVQPDMDYTINTTGIPTVEMSGTYYNHSIMIFKVEISEFFSAF